MADPTIPPLTGQPDQPEVEPLPAAEPLEDPLTDDELREAAERVAAALDQAAPAPAPSNGSRPEPDHRHPAQALPDASGLLRRIDRSVGVMGHDVEQLHADVVRAQRAVQLLALSIGAVACLIIVYAVRGTRSGPSVPVAP